MKHIVTNGILNYNITCKYCGCNFDYDISDVEFRYDSRTTGIDIPDRVVVTCPCCEVDLPHYGKRIC